VQSSWCLPCQWSRRHSWLTEVERALPMPTLCSSCTGCGPSRTGPRISDLLPTDGGSSSGPRDVRRTRSLKRFQRAGDISLIEGDLVAASDAMERSSVAPLHPLVGDLLLSGARACWRFLRGELVLALREADWSISGRRTQRPLSRDWSDSRRHGSRRLASNTAS